jgi:hypothetical protein
MPAYLHPLLLLLLHLLLVLLPHLPVEGRYPTTASLRKAIKGSTAQASCRHTAASTADNYIHETHRDVIVAI